MKLLQVILLSFLLYKVDLTVVDQDSKLFNDPSTKHRNEYIPMIDGEPILIPEEFAETENLDFKNVDQPDLNKIGQNGKSDMPILEMDEVFLATKKPFNKVTSDRETEVKEKPQPKPLKQKKVCKVSATKKIKKITESNKKHLKKSQTKEKVEDSAISRNVVDSSEESLQDEVRSMFGPSFQSFVFNPLAPTKSKFQECSTSTNESGVCRYVQHCFLPSIVSTMQQFMNNVCIIENRFIGVCCPDFPVQTVLVKWKDAQQTFDDLETVDNEIITPGECGVGTNIRIVGGADANIKAWPWMVALLNNKKEFFCGGVLINNRYVLTAAHCTFGIKNDEIIARVGGYDLRDDQGEEYKVVEIKRHGQYNRFTLRNDIALLKLENPVAFNESLKTVCFPDGTKNYTGKIATLTGWGRLQGGISPFTSDILQEVEFPILNNEECSSTHGLPIPESLICTAAPTKDKSACNIMSEDPCPSCFCHAPFSAPCWSRSSHFYHAPVSTFRMAKRKRKTKSTVAKKPKTSPGMFTKAITSLKKQCGSFLEATKENIGTIHKVLKDRLTSFVKKYLKSDVGGESLVQTQENDATGSSKLSASVQTTKASVKKVKQPTKEDTTATIKPKAASLKKVFKAKDRIVGEKVKKKKTVVKKPPATKKAAKPKTQRKYKAKFATKTMTSKKYKRKFATKPKVIKTKKTLKRSQKRAKK